MKQRIYFISGHRKFNGDDITGEKFLEHYQEQLDKALENPNARFVVGDCSGIDSFAQYYLKSAGAENVVVFHMGEDPRNNVGFPTISGFKTDESRDSAMTDVSDEDILWVAPSAENSGTDQNRVRRLNPANTYMQKCVRRNHEIVVAGR